MSGAGSNPPPPEQPWFHKWQAIVVAGIGALGAVAAAVIGLAKSDAPQPEGAEQPPTSISAPSTPAPQPAGNTAVNGIERRVAITSFTFSTKADGARTIVVTGTSLNAGADECYIYVFARPEDGSTVSATEEWYVSPGAQYDARDGTWTAEITIARNEGRPLKIIASILPYSAYGVGIDSQPITVRSAN